MTFSSWKGRQGRLWSLGPHVSGPFRTDRSLSRTLLTARSSVIPTDVALECAGFLAELGFPTTVMVRSILLRGFDKDIAEKIGSFMESHSGIGFLRHTVPELVEKTETGKLLVHFSSASGEKLSEEFDTVLFAIGREADTKALNLVAAGLHVEANGKFNTIHERTNVPHIYAIGDVLLVRDLPLSLSSLILVTDLSCSLPRDGLNSHLWPYRQGNC